LTSATIPSVPAVLYPEMFKRSPGSPGAARLSRYDVRSVAVPAATVIDAAWAVGPGSTITLIVPDAVSPYWSATVYVTVSGPVAGAV
jgi:hypothetical protein